MPVKRVEQALLNPKMVMILAITVALQFTVAAGFLDDCPVDRDLRVDGDLVVDVLESFHKDLVFVQASTDVRKLRDYGDLLSEMHNDYDSASMPWSSTDVHHFFDMLIELLHENQIDQAKVVLNDLRFLRQFENGVEMTYYQYLQAEVNRILGKNKAAASAILLAYSERRASKGISVNQLERLDGLIALQKVSSFNQKVDKLHGLVTSPDYKTLDLVHLITKNELVPLKEFRSAVLSKLSTLQERPALVGSSRASTSSASPESNVQRVDPDQDDLTGKTVSNQQVEGILCEFAQKLSVLEISTREEEQPIDYSNVIDQLRQLDADFAEKLDANIVDTIGTAHERAKKKAYEIWNDILDAPDTEETKEQFLSYFNTELTRRSKDRCDLWALQSMQEDVDTIKRIRKENRGMSLNNIAELEARVALVWLQCSHHRVKMAYELDGSEDEQQLVDKRSRLGSCARTIPFDAITVGSGTV